MPKTVVDGSEFFDGQRVDIHEGRFSGGFILEEEDGVTISNGDQVTFLVTARTSTPKFTLVKKSGDLKRQNTFTVEAAIPVDPDQAKFLYDNIGASVEGVNEGLIESNLATSLLSELESLTSIPIPEVQSNGLGGLVTGSEGIPADPWALVDVPLFNENHQPNFEVVEI